MLTLVDSLKGGKVSILTGTKMHFAQDFTRRIIEIGMLTASMSICTSDSASWEPCFTSPVFNSSHETIPSLSVSINLNISFMSSTSSTDK